MKEKCKKYTGKIIRNHILVSLVVIIFSPRSLYLKFMIYGFLINLHDLTHECPRLYTVNIRFLIRKYTSITLIN